ncbi:hypothetical protein Q9S36_28810 [Microbacterium sp. ARD31]|uniref:hypothetical protein n=1 Tax=Microbacterium sp. ARD31 TaxID=2962576 RepID=UPI002881DBCB|nr:hypothetical protein [Microbacterium sp. ARD31]MDT0184201.1 hypothetical protein [Microbacterium sp. ARD31]
MSTTPTAACTVLRRAVVTVAATCAAVTVTACGAQVEAPRNDIGGVEPQEPRATFTLEDCLDTTRRAPVTTCPYPVKSGDDFAGSANRMRYDDEYARPGR